MATRNQPPSWWVKRDYHKYLDVVAKEFSTDSDILRRFKRESTPSWFVRYTNPDTTKKERRTLRPIFRGERDGVWEDIIRPALNGGRGLCEIEDCDEIGAHSHHKNGKDSKYFDEAPWEYIAPKLEDMIRLCQTHHRFEHRSRRAERRPASKESRYNARTRVERIVIPLLKDGRGGVMYGDWEIRPR